MFKKRSLGIALLALVLVWAPAHHRVEAQQEATSQSGQFQNPALVGGQATNSPQNGIDPSSSDLRVPTAEYFSRDPFQGVDFEQCAQYVRMEAMVQTGVNAATSVLDIIRGESETVSDCTAPLSVALESTECTGYTDSEGKVDLKKIRKAQNRMKNLHNQATCKIRRAQGSAKMTDCFINSLNRAKEAMEQVKADFNGYSEAAKQYITSVKSEIQKEDQKITTLTGKIESIAATKGAIEKVLAQVNSASAGNGKGAGNITELDQRITDHENLVLRFKLTKQKMRVGKILECFSTIGSRDTDFHNCRKQDGGLFDSPTECILSVYHDQVLRQLSHGDSQPTNTDRKKASQAVLYFRDSLSKILRDMANYSDRPGAILPITKYEQRLSKFGVSGKFMISEMKKCDLQETRELERELQAGEGELFSMTQGLESSAKTISSEAGQMVNQLDSAIRDAGKEIFGKELNELVNGHGCNVITSENAKGTVDFRSGSLRTQLKCVRGLNENLFAMLNGTPPPGSKVPLQVPLNVQGSDGFTATCKGLRDCLDVAGQLKGTAVARKASLEGSGTFKDSRCPNGCPGLAKFKAQSDLQIEKAMKKAASLFAQRAEQLKRQLAYLKQTLSQEGVEVPKLEEKKKRDFSCPPGGPPEQICEIPEDIGGTIAAMAGVPPLTDEGFKVTKDSAKQKENEYNDKDKQIQDNIKALQGLGGKCQREEAKELREKQKDARGQLRTIRSSIMSALGDCDAMVSSRRGNAATAEERDRRSAYSQCEQKVNALLGDVAAICSGFEDSDRPPAECRRLEFEAWETKRKCWSECAKISDNFAEPPPTSDTSNRDTSRGSQVD